MKARRIIAEGRIRLLHVDEEAGIVQGEARGDATIYTFAHEIERGWTCSCPARGRCSHLLAAGLVTVIHLRQPR